jgi:hypothetical protein
MSLNVNMSDAALFFRPQLPQRQVTHCSAQPARGLIQQHIGEESMHMLSQLSKANAQLTSSTMSEKRWPVMGRRRRLPVTPRLVNMPMMAADSTQWCHI